MKTIDWALGILFFICFCLAQAVVDANDRAHKAEEELNTCIQGGLIGKDAVHHTALVCRGVEEIPQIQFICPVKSGC